MAHITGDAHWDGVGSAGIGILLVIIAVVLVIEMGSLLVGEGAAPRVVGRIVKAIDGAPSVKRRIHLRTEQVGPEEVVVVAKVEFDHDLSVAGLATAIDEVEARIRAAEPMARLIFIEPDIYREPAGGV
jgi:divalent metal cation (Fe/Co/Zn/Cd) transporter